MSEQAVAEQPQAQPKKRYVYQVLAGSHWEKGMVKDDRGQQVVRDIKYGPGRPAGDIVETDVELDKRFNRPGLPPKFKRVGEDGVKDARAEELKVERKAASSAKTALRKALEKMPRAELVAWAEEQEIDLKGAVKREDVLRIILAVAG